MKMIRCISIIFLLATILSCETRKKVDLIVRNAKVYTIDSAFSIVESFAVSNGKIEAIGTSREIAKGYITDWVIDAKGKPIFPGFIDAHCHFYGYGTQLIKYAELTGSRSFDEVLERLKIHLNENPGEWIVGMGWDQNDWEEKEFPDNELLDELFPDKYVMIIRIDGHAVLANSRALELIKIDKRSYIPGGEIIKKNGQLTGMLLDNAADSLKHVYRSLSETNKDRALLAAQKNCLSVGLTSIVDAGLDADVINVIDALQQNGMLKMRVYAMLQPTDENIDKYVKNGYYQTDRLNVRSIKLYADGALGSRGALLLEPYSDDNGNFGILVNSAEYLRKYCKIAYENQYQVNTHAIGDSAVRMVLHIYNEFLEGKNDYRWRIEHSQVVNESDFELFAKNSIIPSVQSTHATSDMYWAGDRLGFDRLKNAYAYKKLLEQNLWLPNGTDFPIENINPLYTFYAAVFRKDLQGYPEEGFQMENALSREEALKSMTIWAAMGSFEENIKGSLEIGKWADFVILDDDILTTDQNNIPLIDVLGTYIAGEEVYKKD